MQLKNKFIVKEIHKKTKARLFQDVEIGDVLLITMTIQNTTTGRGNYATIIEVERESDTQFARYTQSELSSVLNRCFTLEQYEETDHETIQEQSIQN